MATKNYKVKRIEAIQRAASVLKYLHLHGGSQLKTLHDALAIAKPTLLRILATLRDEGFVWQRLADDAWLISWQHQYVVSLKEPLWLAEISGPILEALSTQVPWPSQIAIPDGDAMRVIESNYSQTFIDPLPPRSIGFRAPMLRSASGRAWFAYASEERRHETLEAMRQRGGRANSIAHDASAIGQLIRETRESGFAVREPHFGGDFERDRSDVDDRRDSIGLPILCDGEAIASMNFTWKNQVVDRDRVTKMHFRYLRAAVSDIETAANEWLKNRHKDLK